MVSGCSPLSVRQRFTSAPFSQCDNLALMKMSSQIDLDELGKIFGFAPSPLLSIPPDSGRARRCLPEASRLSP